ncbi:MAG: MFS transporter [Acidimicrobiia bacterium]|nr:MFS transporter [Acidimicrobiia bacterium]
MSAVARTGRLYYGWVVAWVGFGVLTLTYGVQFSFGIALPYIVEDLGISRSKASLAFSLYVLVYSALSSVSGSITDRKGPKVVLAGGAVLLGVGYVLTALAQTYWQLLVALGLVAGLGMSASFVPCNATVVRWFVRKRGKALSVSTSGGSVAAIIVPFVVGRLADRVDWRTLYVGMAVVVLVGLGVAAWLIERDPEAKGLTVDDEMGGDGSGRSPSAGAADAPLTPLADESSLTAREASRTAVFWVMGGIFLCSWLVVFLPLVHLSPFAKDLGASAGLASSLVSAVGIGGLAGRTMTGGLSDRIGRLPALGAVLATQVASFLVFAGTGRLAVLFPAAVAFGFGYGGTTTVFPAIVGDRFGRAHAGAIVGLVFAGSGSAAAVGPFVAAWIHDVTGSYRIAFLLSAAVNGLALLLVFALGALIRRADAQPAAPLDLQPPAAAPAG